MTESADSVSLVVNFPAPVALLLDRLRGRTQLTADELITAALFTYSNSNEALEDGLSARVTPNIEDAEESLTARSAIEARTLYHDSMSRRSYTGSRGSIKSSEGYVSIGERAKDLDVEILALRRSIVALTGLSLPDSSEDQEQFLADLSPFFWRLRMLVDSLHVPGLNSMMPTGIGSERRHVRQLKQLNRRMRRLSYNLKRAERHSKNILDAVQDLTERG